VRYLSKFDQIIRQFYSPIAISCKCSQLLTIFTFRSRFQRFKDAHRLTQVLLYDGKSTRGNPLNVFINITWAVCDWTNDCRDVMGNLSAARFLHTRLFFFTWHCAHNKQRNKPPLAIVICLHCAFCGQGEMRDSTCHLSALFTTVNITPTELTGSVLSR